MGNFEWEMEGSIWFYGYTAQVGMPVHGLWYLQRQWFADGLDKAPL